MKNKKSKQSFCGGLVVLIIFLFMFTPAFAQDTSVKYNLIQPLPGIQSVPDFPTWTSIFIPFLLGLAGLLSLIQIVRGGIMRAVSGGNPSAIGDANDMIWQAILGLVLALSAYLILNTINPDLVNLKFEPLEIRIAPPAETAQNCDEKKCPASKPECVMINNKPECLATIPPM